MKRATERNGVAGARRIDHKAVKGTIGARIASGVIHRDLTKDETTGAGTTMIGDTLTSIVTEIVVVNLTAEAQMKARWLPTATPKVETKAWITERLTSNPRWITWPTL